MTDETTPAAPAPGEPEQAPPPDGPTPAGQPDGAEQDEIDEGDETQAEAGQRNVIEEFVRDLPAGYALCPTCQAVGAVLEDPPFNPHTMTCPDCLGHTRVRTGALTGNEVEIKCERCNARGWIARDGLTPPASPARASDLQDGATPRDVNGRTPDDPEFDWAQVVRDVEPIALAAVE